MAEDDKKGLSASIAHAAAAFAQTPLPFLVGMGVVIAAGHWDGHFQSQKGCLEVQQISGKFFKVDSCNGKVEEIAVAPSAAPPKSPKETTPPEGIPKTATPIEGAPKK